MVKIFQSKKKNNSQHNRSTDYLTPPTPGGEGQPSPGVDGIDVSPRRPVGDKPSDRPPRSRGRTKSETLEASYDDRTMDEEEDHVINLLMNPKRRPIEVDAREFRDENNLI